MNILKETIGQVHVISLVGRIEASQIKTFQSAVEESILAGHYALVLDLQYLEYLSSSALRILYKMLAFLEQKSNDQGKIVLCAPSEEVKKIFDFIDLSADFPIFCKKEDALKAIRGLSP